MNKDTPIGKFWWLVGWYAAHYPSQRRGQATFNVLYEVRPDLSELIRGTVFDAFYQDSKLDVMCDWIERHWKEESL